jgi:hypothetical protein
MSAFGGKADMVCDHDGSGIAFQNESVGKKMRQKFSKYSQLNALAGVAVQTAPLLYPFSLLTGNFCREFLKNRGFGNPRDSKKSPLNTAFDAAGDVR